MRREASIPLFLWAASAILAHLLWSGGADQAARLIEERLDVASFAAGVRNHVRGAVAPPLEIALEDEAAPDEEAKPEETKAEDDVEDDAKDDPEEAPEKLKDKPEPPPKQKPKPEEKKPEPVKVPEPPKPEPPKPELVKPATPAEEPKPQPELELPKKIAVKQHVEDEQQKDNPDAKFIADKANKVAEETQARITSTDQNERKPSPGAAPSGPKEDPGNAEETHVRQDSDQAGLRAVAPGGSHSSEATRTTASTPAPKAGTGGATAPGAPGSQVAKEAKPAIAESQDRDQTAKAATPESAGSPEVVASNDGSFSMSRPQAATPEQRARKAKKKLPPRRPRSLLEAIGLGAAGRTMNGVALNLTPNMAAEAVGSDEMSRLRRADGERRRSQHRGSWATPSFERYRSAIENYVPSVKPGDATALNTAANAFAGYLNQVHSRIHPIFADEFLASLDQLPASHPMNDQKLVTAIEMVLEREEGRLVRRGVTHTSGITAFDISAIAAIERAAPFGTPPSEIVSPDGKVYVHWEFRRDGMACSTLYAQPIIKRALPTPAPLPTPLPPFRGPDETAPEPEQRHGLLTPPGGPKSAAPKG